MILYVGEILVKYLVSTVNIHCGIILYKHKTVINIMIKSSYGNLRVILQYYEETGKEEMFRSNMMMSHPKME